MLHVKLPLKPVPKEKILKDFTIYSPGGHLGHVRWIIYINIHSTLARGLLMKFDLIGQLV